MAARDRRSGEERRGSNRYPIEIDVQWESTGARKPGSISDVSLDGCFVLSSGDVNDGEALGIALANRLLAAGADKILTEVYETEQD